MYRIKKLLSILIIISLFACNHQYAAASDSNNMEKVIKYYSNGKYKKALQYGKKLGKYAKDQCVKNMSTSMKKAYLEVVKQYPSVTFKKNDGMYMWDYYLTDIDNDKKTDLLVIYGSCEADVKLVLYQYIDGMAQEITSVKCSNSSFSAYPKHKGIIRYENNMGEEALYILTLKEGKIISGKVGSRYVEKPKNYLKIGCHLKGHSFYEDEVVLFSYDDLK